MDDAYDGSKTSPNALPPVPGSSAQKQQAVNPPAGAVILIVDDDLAMLELGCDYLRQQGYVVLPASLPSQAIEIVVAGQGIIDLLVTDIIMPEMNGQELADTIAHLSPGTKTLFMSGYTSEVVTQERRANADFHFIAKPFSLKQFKEKIKELIVPH